VETIVRDAPSSGRARRTAALGSTAVAQPLAALPTEDAPRLSVGLGELDRVLGGGLVAGSLVLVGGEPGIGKSTLLLQAAAGLVAGGRTVLYATGEESSAQVRLRAARLGLLEGPAGAAVHVLAEHDVGRVVEAARAARPAALVVDSIQTATVDELEGPAGSVGQVREAAVRLLELAKGERIAVILVGHVTKEGSIAGPRTLEHLVDAVVSIEGERSGALRLVRSSKNRFGATDEVGVLEMAEGGLREIADPARAFLVDHPGPAPGSVVAATVEGSRALLVEVQALAAPTAFGMPRRTAIGLDPNRLALLVAVLGRRAGVALGSHDVYANLAGGISVADPGLDLALALALASAARDRAVRPGTIAFGEVGLLGELRAVGGTERRLREGARLGFVRAIVPRTRGASPAVADLEVVPVATVREALVAALEPGAGGRGPTAAAAEG